ncbi:MAG: hypothetical protein R3288_10345 [Woeseiaceae bacterium]|nr:hypothetical protein [Woeseiaceae bacterium]
MAGLIRTLTLYLLLSLTAAAQTPAEPPADEAETQPEAAAEPEQQTTAADEPAEVLETDDESYLDIDDEDFTPSEEIPADQSITFPTDI